MSFNPTAASPQVPTRPLNPPRSRLPPPVARRTPLTPQLSVTSLGSGPGSAPPSIEGWKPENISVIEDIIGRVPKNVTALVSVFKIYNDVLQERKIDPNADVFYYGFLLKLSTQQGPWMDRWQKVKTGDTSVTKPLPKFHAAQAHDHSIITETETETDEDTILHKPQALPKRQAPQTSTLMIEPTATSTPILSTRRALPRTTPSSAQQQRGRPAVTPRQPISQRRAPNPTPSGRHDPSTTTTRDSSSSDARPPSYRTYPPEPTEIKLPSSPQLQPQTPSQEVQPIWRPPAGSGNRLPRTLKEFAQAAARAGKLHLPTAVSAPSTGTPGGSGINAEETWKVLRMEADADDFRQFSFFRKYWDVWFKAAQNRQRRYDQVSLAYSHVVTRQHLGIWRSHVSKYVDFTRRADSISRVLLLRKTWKAWRATLAEQQKRKWQQDMKSRIAEVRKKTTKRILAEAFHCWLLQHQGQLATKFLRRNVLARVVQSWRRRLENVDRQLDIADRVVSTRDQMCIAEKLNIWRRKTKLKKLEYVVVRMRQSRLLERTLQTWKDSRLLLQVAHRQWNLGTARVALARWRNAYDRNQALERRADHYIHLQDRGFLGSLMRLWVAKERATLLHRVQKARIQTTFFSRWRDQLGSARDLEELLQLHHTQRNISILRRVFGAWHEMHSNLNAALNAAGRHRDLEIKAEAFQGWKATLAANRKDAKGAKFARRWFVARSAWKQWRAVLQDRRRQKKLKEFETGVVGRAFREWHSLARRKRQEQLLVSAFQEQSQKRIMSGLLQTWVELTVSRKLLEVEVQEARGAMNVKHALDRWKSVYRRHKDEMSLMQSYHDVKRDDLVRRTLLRWLGATRKSVHRRRRLEQALEERDNDILVRVWDAWRDKFRERELAFLEKQLRMQTDMNILFRGFRIWESKTRLVPAVRFSSLNIKAKAWNRWREALPRASKAREAREVDRNRILSKALGAWKEAYRNKIQLKSIARARHLRLPVVPSPRPTYRRPALASGTAGLSAIARVAARQSASPERRPPPVLSPQKMAAPPLREEDTLVEAQHHESEGPSPPPKVTTRLSAFQQLAAAASKGPLAKLGRSAASAYDGGGSEAGDFKDSDAKSEPANRWRMKSLSPEKPRPARAESVTAMSSTSRDRLRLELRSIAPKR